MGSKGQDKLCMLCRKGEDSGMKHGALHGVQDMDKVCL